MTDKSDQNKKVLVVKKNDGTVHIVPEKNRLILQGFIRKQPIDKKWVLIDMTLAEARKLEYIDKEFVPPAAALIKLAEAKTALSAKETEFENLQRLYNELLAAKGEPVRAAVNDLPGGTGADANKAADTTNNIAFQEIDEATGLPKIAAVIPDASKNKAADKTKEIKKP